MKVKLLVSRAGVDFSQIAGEEITVSDEEGLRMIKSGQAEAVNAKKETATKKAPLSKRVK